MTVLKKIIKGFLELWNIYGGIAASAFIAWLLNYSKESIDLLTSMLVLGLTICSVLTFIKITVFKKKPKHITEKAVLSQATIKAMTNAIDPMATGEEIGNAIIQTNDIIERTGTNVMNWIKKNVGAIIATLLAIIGALEQCFDFVWALFPTTSIPFNVISVVLYSAGAVVGALTSGFGSIEFKEKLAMIKDQLDGDKTDLTLIRNKKYLERQITQYTKEVENTESEQVALRKKYAKAIDDYDASVDLGLPIDDEALTTYRKYVEENKNILAKKEAKEKALATYKAKLEEVLASENAA